MALHESSSATLRLTLVSLVVVGMFTALFSRLWFLQVLAGERYAELAERNRVQWAITEAPRGRILDQDGDAIVKNRPALTVSADKRRLLNGAGQPRDADAAAVLERLSALLQLPQEEIVARLTDRRYSPFRPVPIVKDVPPEVVFQIEEHRELYPGVEPEVLPIRTYPHGTAAAHVVGYIGEINDEELASDEYRGYRLGDLIGQSGLEASYEEHLQGESGLRQLEVNAKGAVLGVLAERPPVPGADLRTTIDLDVQLAAETILRDGLVAARDLVRSDGQDVPAPAGAVVVVDVRDGGVVAMASYPTFDPAQFLGGISQTDWAFLQDPANHFPLLNRAVSSAGAVAPGSTFKPITAAAAMKAGLIGPNSRLPCPGALTIGRRWRNWTPRNEGAVDVAVSLMRSCDTFYYQLGHELWQRDEARIAAGQEPLELVENTARDFGLGRRLGLDLPEEGSGRIPGRAWKREFVEALGEDCTVEPAWECTWRYYDAINQSIGQGYVSATPLQIASAYAAIANGGTLWRPHFGAEIVAPDGEVIDRIEPEAIGQLGLAPEHLEELQRGLEMVVMEPRGTAAGAFRGFPLDRIPVAGKTGTAEIKGKVPYAWFAAYAPADAPRYAVAVMVEQGSSGSGGAAPIVRRVLEAAFDLPITPFPGATRDAGE